MHGRLREAVDAATATTEGPPAADEGARLPAGLEHQAPCTGWARAGVAAVAPFEPQRQGERVVAKGEGMAVAKAAELIGLGVAPTRALAVDAPLGGPATEEGATHELALTP